MRENLTMRLIVVIVTIIAFVFFGCGRPTQVKNVTSGIVEERLLDSKYHVGDTIYLFPYQKVRQPYVILHE